MEIHFFFCLELYTPDQWEIDKDSVTLEGLIGQGHFGQVYKGVLKLQDGTLTPCAVKLRTTHPTDLLQEASIMKQFQCHHVIQLYGICSRIRPPYVVMELMENGDLKNYLYRHRQSEHNPNEPTLSESAMIQLALDVADGMYYLSDQKFVHRDLAARNCLVNGNHTCKVGDFGLTRDIYETDYYRRGGRSFLPIRWMAPESLRDGRFDTVSDVWSFGVLLWEIATLAEQPYQGYGNEEVVHYVRYGNITLERPLNCPEILHKLMRACWTFSPGDRISFRSIVDELVPMFSRLHHIGITTNATITIEENEFLTELWPLSQPPPIIQGSLNIVRNARLCLKQIVDFVNYTMTHEKELQVTPNTMNEYANGYLASCESNFLRITIDRIRSLTARVNVAVPKELFFRSSGKAEHLRRPFLSVYYKPTRTKNETHFDAIQSHKWLRLVEKVNYNLAPHGGSFTMSVELTSLFGDEWYAVYASITSNVNTVGLFSPIAYFRTLQRQPESVVNLRGESLSRSTIELMWQPPSKSHGPIATYLVYYAPIEDRLPVDNWKLLCLMKDRWPSEVNARRTDLNYTQAARCPRPKSRVNDIITDNDEEFDEDAEENQGIDQVVTDLSVLEYQLINSVSQRKEALFIRPELKDTIINDLDHYFEDKSSAFNDQLKSDSQEQPVVEHKPYVTDYNRSIANTRVIIDRLKEAQLYMFQVYACHDISTQVLSDACSHTGITITVRTKAGDPSRDIVRNVKLITPVDNSNHLTRNTKSFNYYISWSKPLQPNGLVYFYMVYIGQDSNNGPKEERCVGHDTHSVNVTLLPRTTYRLRIITYTIARLDNEYKDKQVINDEQYSLNTTNLFFQLIFTTKDLPGNELTRQNRIILIILITGSILLLSIIIIGAPFYYYKYGRGDTKASISKNPNYELYTPDQWEIDKDSVTLEGLIGQGHFGQVYKGVLKLQDGTLTPCAVKLRTTHPTDLLQEASIMKQFQCHHVIQLYGICSRIRPPYVVMELMENGDLKNYLYRHRQSEHNPNEPTLSESAMIQLALDVADGMYYLSDQKFVHRDLAARNCLVNGNHTCKVGDFGLTRDIYETDYYRRGGRSFLPIRWMAPESLRDGRFDTVSDVWSFGVLLWEIATLAEQPYQGYGNEEVVHYVRYGNITLERPLNCPEILHKLMRACWTFSPGDRISFRSIVDELVPYENEEFHLHAYYHTQPNQIQETVLVNSNNNDEEDLLLVDDDDDSAHF
ncbi:unnamed protein product [Adineta steineri]|uniref:Tyrosine-protein kinase receptor n=1 Tax=Adineta steineri TaxID=433720 RepID=A0A814JBL2_9BILA|nr:unnamed protein product [Adineta steineri]